VSEQCFDGHIGALCGACDDGYDFDIGRNRCAQCSSSREMMARAGNLFLLFAIAAAVAVVLYARCRRQIRKLWASAVSFAREGFDSLESQKKEGLQSEVEARSRRRRKLRKSLFTKAKVVIAAWQIAASTETVLLQVRFPPVFAKAMKFFHVLGLAAFEVGSLNCFFRWSYFEKMLFATLAPFVGVAFTAGPYWLVQRYRGKLESEAGRRKVTVRIAYSCAFAIYIILPSVSTSVITYFSCSRFADDGLRRGLRVIASELSIKCTNKRYRQWRIYAGIMIGIWPVGVPLVFATLLWSKRAKLNPPLENYESRRAKDGVDKAEGLQREELRHMKAINQLEKLELRDSDDSLEALAFVFEEYKPRCYLFPIFEITRRIFLTSVLAIFYPGSTRQSVIGMLGAMLACVVYYYYEPFIEDDDNVVSAVAQGELVLIYFAALAVFTAQAVDESRRAFSNLGFGVVLVMIFFTSSLVAIYVILLDVFGYERLFDVYLTCPQTFAKTRNNLRGRLQEFLGPSNAPSTLATTTTYEVGLV